ncbi:GNAT family N-acetyltransferase [Pedobacter cryoconitis]|uniref:RimJ/RimL family protein N-acetyltransferase n=1 Tax=Pedobacter cryoconitis TaxID=188932 RepID=A0A7X0J0G5_9SPHI|nr:GNAT family N-acetyltransferase [Pedobacter cryoconitis]MBB6498533.1 RimJ/RimL family protein N-acetyltransferase [Pedobacter cryoconitis]
MNFSIQLQLENERIKLVPLTENDFDELYQVASDKEIWAQHPNKDRWQKEVFQQFFEGAIQSKGAFRIVDKTSGETIGSTRFYDYDELSNSILIGYTFYATHCWGKGYNPSVKKLMMDYIFQYVDKVLFHVGALNIRSQIAMTRLGAKKIAEQEISYFGELPKPNHIYEISKESNLSDAKV